MSVMQRFHRAIDSTGAVRPALDALSRLDRRHRLPTQVDRVPITPPASPAPLFSVIIPCYNYGHFLPAAVSSALAQGGVDVEVIIVDDASTDDSYEVAEKLRAGDERVQLLCNPSNLGHVRTFNNGWQAATGEFIVRLDADDLLTQGSLFRSWCLFSAFPRVGLVYGHPHHFTSAEHPEPWMGVPNWTVWSGADWLAERCRRGVNCISTPEAVLRGSVLQEVGPLDTRLRYAQDMEMWLRISAVSDVGRINGAEQALHRDHAASMSATEAADALVDLVERRRVFECLFSNIGDRLACADDLAQLAKRALASDALERANYLYDRGRYDPKTGQGLAAFARETYSAYRELPGWNGLQRRQRLGAALVRRLPTSAVRVVGSRLTSELEYLRWSREGL